jgi:hypothetical protein
MADFEGACSGNPIANAVGNPTSVRKNAAEVARR